jgi:hypothetical protein
MQYTKGALVGVLFVSALCAIPFGSWAVFWIIFCTGALVSLPFALIFDSVAGANDRREDRADARMGKLSDEYYQMIARQQVQQVSVDARSIHIDARRVHYHQENKAKTGFIDTP